MMEIKPEDCRWDSFRAAGQKVNEMERCIRLIHEPSGTVIDSCEHRSQAENRMYALWELEFILSKKP